MTDADGAAALVERTIAAARLAPADPAWPGLAAAGPAGRQRGNFDEATAAPSPDERAARVRAFVDAAGGLTRPGYCRTQLRARRFANTAGQPVAGAPPRRRWTASPGPPARTAWPGSPRSRLADLDGAVLGARAAAKARAGADPVELPPGRYEVVLEPDGGRRRAATSGARTASTARSFVERQSFAAARRRSSSTPR